MEEERIIVNLFEGSRKYKQTEFRCYESALSYSKKYVSLGYSCQILRQIGGKTWCKVNMYPPETM